MELIRETNLYDNDAIADMRTSLDKKFASTYGTCSTGASTVAKVVTLADFTLFKGAQISVYFTYANTAASPTLNVNGTGAKAIWARGAVIASQYYWSAKSLQKFVYDGSNWVMDAESQEEAFDRLTNDGAIKGIFMSNGQMYINMDYLQTGILKLGGASADATNGLMIIYNSSGTEIGRWSKDGVIINSGSLNIGNGKFVVTSAGALTATSATISGDITSIKSLGSYREIRAYIASVTYYKYTTSGLTPSTGNGFSIQYFNSDEMMGSHSIIIDAYGGVYEYTLVPTSTSAGYSRNVTVYSANTAYSAQMRESFNRNCDYSLSLAEHASSGTTSTATFTYDGSYWKLTGANQSGNIAIQSSSSKRYKHAISADIDKCLDPKKLYKLQMKQFIFNDDHLLQYEDMRGQTIGGFIAEDVDKIYPSAVIHNNKGEIESWDERRIIPAMLKLIQEQHDEIEKLKQVVHVA